MTIAARCSPVATADRMTSANGTFETCRPLLTISVVGGKIGSAQLMNMQGKPKKLSEVLSVRFV